LKDEFTPNIGSDFVNFFKEAGIDYFVQDAFSVLHRNQSSIVSLPKVLPSATGLVLEEELKNIERIKSKLKNSLFVLGGNKAEDLLPLLKNKRILTTGKLSLLALKAKGFPIVKGNGLSEIELKLVPKIKKYSENLVVPVDLALNVKGKRKEISLNELPQKYLVWDIGFQTIENYKKEIVKAKTIFVKGAAGMFEDKNFEKGTKEILKAVEKSKAFAVAAGGSTLDSIEKFKINKKKFGYVSLSGGALVKYLAGEKLVGLEVLK
jgi:phosphoglycerate kinase